MTFFITFWTSEKNVENTVSYLYFNPLSANPTKWLNTLKQFVGSVFDHFVGLTVKGLTKKIIIIIILQVKIQDFRSAILPPFQFVWTEKKAWWEPWERTKHIHASAADLLQ